MDTPSIGPRPETETAALVALCDGAHRGEDGLDPAEIRSSLSSRSLAIAVEIVGDLCRRPALLPDLVGATGAARAVLGLCGNRPSSEEVQAWARKAGLDPFGAEAVDLGMVTRTGVHLTAAERAAALLAAAVAAVGASPRTDADQLRMRLPREGVSRRALFAIGPVTYNPVASVDRLTCVGTARCGLCVSTCPVDAIRPSKPTPSVSSESCVACGACVSTCPAGAIGLPGANLGQFEARLASLLSWPWPDGSRPGLLFTCRGATTALRGQSEEGAPTQADWLPVMVPCLSMVTPGWILAALAAGAPAVGMLGCGDRCGVERGERTRARVDHCRDVLGALTGRDSGSSLRFLTADGDDPPRALGEVLGEPLTAGEVGGPVHLAEPTATAGALRRLADGRIGGHADVSVPGPASPLGVVHIQQQGCTLCGICAGVCPTFALSFDQRAETATLAFQGGKCLACRHCVDVCPEHVLTVEARTDLPSILGGTRELKRGTVATCRRCGRPVAPTAMVQRLRELLPDQPPELLDLVGGLCLDCRGL